MHLFGIYMISITKMHGCETWSLTLREERRLRVFENRVLRRVFGPKRDEVTGEWRKLHNEELSDLYFTFLYSLIHTFLHLSLFFYSHIYFLLHFIFLKSFSPSNCPVSLFSKIRPPAHCQMNPITLQNRHNPPPVT